MTLKKNDFIEIEFTAKVKDGEVFDSNIKEHLQKLNSDAKAESFTFALGQGMFLEGIDNYLIGKEIGEYKIELTPEKAFGKREAKLVQMMPMKVFIEHKLNPIPGAMFNFDNKIAKILTVSGGRVMVDFNNPLSGKDVVYDIKILRKVEDQKEKIEALNKFLFKKDFKFEIKDKKLTMDVEKGMSKFIEMFKDKYKEIFDLDLIANEPQSEVEKEMPTKESIKEKIDEKIGEVKERVEGE